MQIKALTEGHKPFKYITATSIRVHKKKLLKETRGINERHNFILRKFTEKILFHIFLSTKNLLRFIKVS